MNGPEQTRMIRSMDVGLNSEISSETFITGSIQRFHLRHFTLDQFDLDICRMAIYKDQYINRLETILHMIFLPSDQLSFRRGGINVMDSYFEPFIFCAEPTAELEILKNRIMKYCVRLNYGHFSQFSTPIEQLTRSQYFKIQSQEKAFGPTE